MTNAILRPNGAPLYGFLSWINTHDDRAEPLSKRKILDCGAGGPVPPLVLFQQHGFQCFGIDASAEQLDRAGNFCQEQGIEIDLREGDMRRLPFEDDSFDYVYEHYSMCHLSREDTALAVSEMHRVLKPGGMCFLGVILTDSWPKSLFGSEREPGEFWGEEDGELALHSMFTGQLADDLVSDWEIIRKEKNVRYLREAALELSRDEWMDLHCEAGGGVTEAEWSARYAQRAGYFQYAHLYYYLKKV